MDRVLENSGENRGNAGSRWGQLKNKMNIPSPGSPKQPEIEFRKVVLRVGNKNISSLKEMEKRLKSRSVSRQKTEAELMKERLKHVEFSDEEKGFLTKEQMNAVSQKVGAAKRELAEIEKDGKSNGKMLKDYVGNFKDWQEELKFLTDNELHVDLESLLQARKRIIIRDLFYDPEEAERRRKAREEALRLQREREAQIQEERRRIEEARLALLEDEKSKLLREQEERMRKLKEEEEARLRVLREEEDKLKKYEEDVKRKLSANVDRRREVEEENKAKRTNLLKKFATSEQDLEEDEKTAKRRNWSGVESDGQKNVNKPRSRRASKVGKLDSPFEAGPDGLKVKPSWSRTASRAGSRTGSRRTSRSNSRRTSPTSFTPLDLVIKDEQVFAKEVGAALAGLQELTARAYNDEEK